MNQGPALRRAAAACKFIASGRQWRSPLPIPRRELNRIVKAKKMQISRLRANRRSPGRARKRRAWVWFAAAALLLAAVSPGGPIEAIAQVSQEKIVNVYGWPDYIDPKVLEAFTKDTGIKVTYDAYDSNDEFESRILGGAEGFDVVIVSGRELDKQIATGRFLRLDKSKIPNLKNLSPEVMARLSVYDPGNQYAVNYLWFALGLAYNEDKVAEVLGDAAAGAWRGSGGESKASWDVLFRPEILRKFADCGVTVPDKGDEMFAIALIYLKADPASVRWRDLKEAGDLLSGLRRYVKFDAGDYVDDLANGETCLAVSQSLDGLRARERARAADSDAEIGFAVPREGSLMILDNLAIPANARNVEEAHAFINFLLRPEVAARDAGFTHLASGVLAARQGADARAKGGELRASEQLIRRLFPAPARAPSSQRALSREWARAKTGK